MNIASASLTKIQSHPCFVNANEIKQICTPLKKFNISYFAHARVDKEGRLTGVSNQPEWFEHFLLNKYYMISTHLSRALSLPYAFWDDLPMVGQASEMHRESQQFGIYHGLAIIKKSKYHDDFYYFATDKQELNMRAFYLFNLDLLELFIAHYHSELKQKRGARRYLDIYFKTEPLKEQLLNCSSETLSTDKQDFVELCQPSKLIVDAFHHLTKRELEILFWFHKGKTLEETSLILNIGISTVNKHVGNIKHKLQIDTLFNLGEEYASRIHSVAIKFWESMF